MKKTYWMLLMLAAVLLVSCGKTITGDVIDGEGDEDMESVDVKARKFTFTVKGDFGGIDVNNEKSTEPALSKRKVKYLYADDNNITDLWVFDYMNGSLVQSVHQSSTDEGFGQPQMSLSYGDHHVYFVASRGDSPTVDNDNTSILWSPVKDTFWKDYEVTVGSTSNGNRAVTLDRVVTRLRVTATDEVPTGCASMTLTPAVWYYGLNYVTGAPTDAHNNEAKVINVPSSYIGTTGQLTTSIFSVSGTAEWNTNVSVVAKNSNGDVIGSATIANAPFKANRSTDFSGPLFGSAGAMSVSINDDWSDPYEGTW